MLKKNKKNTALEQQLIRLIEKTVNQRNFQTSNTTYLEFKHNRLTDADILKPLLTRAENFMAWKALS